MARANDRGKDNERAFAKFMSNWLGIEVRRNDARVNADDSSRNSDVDVEHELLRVYAGPERDIIGRLVAPMIYRGITAELKYRSNEFKTIYKWMKEDSRKGEQPTIMIVNTLFHIFKIESLPVVYSLLVRRQPIPLHESLSMINVAHRTVKTDFKALYEGAEQAARYGRTKKLFPLQVVRMKGERQLVVIREIDLYTLDIERNHTHVR